MTRLLALAALLVAVLASSAALAEPFCDSFYGGFDGWVRSDANRDLYNGVAFALIGGAVSLGGDAGQRWSAVNSLDENARSDFRLEKPGDRRRADVASDVTLASSLAVLPVLSIGVQQWRTGDCEESWDMATDLVEAFGLSLMISESIKLASGRLRPFNRECGPDGGSDETCPGGDRFRSFVSGHATLAATGAGLTCAWSVKRRAWGSTRLARAMPCAVGSTLALATASLRVNADRHWLTDVLAGLAIGGTVGWFDTWGPFDLLRYESAPGPDGEPEAFGFVLPSIVEGGPGIRAAFVF
ncbi:MAG: phosphatase PAP2 family protein [bacterium]|nr:phosphatase PAP2 family protein [bacterium]